MDSQATAELAGIAPGAGAADAGIDLGALADAVAIRAIADARAAFVEAIRAGNVRAVADLYEDGARLIAPDTDVLRGRGEVEAFWRAGVESGIADVRLEPEDVELLPSLAWEVGRYVLRLQPEGGADVVDRGRYLLVYRLDGGRWARAAEMFAPDAMAASDGRTP